MKKFLLTLLLCLGVSVHVDAQSAKSVLDKTAATFTEKGAVKAEFVIKHFLGQTQNGQPMTGSILLNGKKFKLNAEGITTWFDGKTQWTYMKSSEEVNVCTPNESQQAQMNPYKFITLYKNGYRLGVKEQGNGWEIHLTALNRGRSIQEMYVYVSKSYLPTKVRILEERKWSEIKITNFKNSPKSDSVFTFNAKDFPEAEVIDLR